MRVSRCTSQNITSSRSHLLIQFELVNNSFELSKKKQVSSQNTGSLTFVDLAGSEKYDMDLPKGDSRLQETTAINKR
jgi:hypothetical protein